MVKLADEMAFHSATASLYPTKRAPMLRSREEVTISERPKRLLDLMQTLLSIAALMERETGTVHELKLCEELSKTAGLSGSEAHTLVKQLIRDGVLHSRVPYPRAPRSLIRIGMALMAGSGPLSKGTLVTYRVVGVVHGTV